MGLVKLVQALGQAIFGIVQGFMHGIDQYGGVVLAEADIAGNFRPVFLDSRVATVAYPFFVPPRPPLAEAGQCLVVWDAKSGGTPPRGLARFLSRAFGASLSGEAPQSVEAPYRHGDPRRLKLHYMILPDTGECR